LTRLKLVFTFKVQYNSLELFKKCILLALIVLPFFWFQPDLVGNRTLQSGGGAEIVTQIRVYCNDWWRSGIMEAANKVRMKQEAWDQYCSSN
jgi:hypothetical protein